MTLLNLSDFVEWCDSQHLALPVAEAILVKLLRAEREN